MKNLNIRALAWERLGSQTCQNTCDPSEQIWNMIKVDMDIIFKFEALIHARFAFILEVFRQNFHIEEVEILYWKSAFLIKYSGYNRFIKINCLTNCHYQSTQEKVFKHLGSFWFCIMIFIKTYTRNHVKLLDLM